MTDQNNDAAWFAQKRFGYGAGLPLTWQGWALLGGYMITIFLLAWLIAAAAPAVKVVAIMLFALATGLFVEVSRRRTRGGWKWRWGKPY
jgi:hypothetical protein